MVCFGDEGGINGREGALFEHDGGVGLREVTCFFFVVPHCYCSSLRQY